MTEWTWGATGTYATLAAAATALPATLDDNYDLIQVGDSVEPAALFPRFGAAPVATAGYTLRIYSDTPHGGNPNIGHTVSVTPGVNYWIWTTQDELLKLEIFDLHFIRTGGAATPCLIEIYCGNSEAKRHDVKIYNNIFLPTAAGYGTSIGVGGTAVKYGYVHIYNNKIGPPLSGSAWKYCIIVDSVENTEGTIIENNAIDIRNQQANGIGAVRLAAWWINPNATIRNNVVINPNAINSVCYVDNSLGTSTFINNASQDATGSTGLQNIVPADEFASLTNTDDDYLFLKDGALSGAFTRNPAGNVYVGDKILFTPSLTYTPGSAILARYGVAPTYATTDIAGVARPGSSGWYSIGCHEGVYT